MSDSDGDGIPWYVRVGRDEGDEAPESAADAGGLTAAERQRADFVRYTNRSDIEAQTRRDEERPE